MQGVSQFSAKDRYETFLFSFPGTEKFSGYYGELSKLL
jgi:hypothetical protein